MAKLQKINILIIIIASLVVLLLVSIGINIWQFVKLQGQCSAICEGEIAYQIPENNSMRRAYIEFFDNAIPGRTYRVNMSGKKVEMEITGHTSVAGMEPATEENSFELSSEQYDQVWEILRGLNLNPSVYREQGYDFYYDKSYEYDKWSEVEVLGDLMLALKMLGDEDKEEVIDGEKLLRILVQDVNLDL